MSKVLRTQLILYVRSVADSLRFYRDCLGFAVTFPTYETDLTSEHWLTLDAGGTSLALHAGGDPNPGQSSPALSFYVTDLRAFRDELTTQGVVVSEIVEPHPGVLLCDTRDPDGNVVFFKQN